MATFYAQEAQIDQEIQQVLNQPISRIAKLSMIKDIRKSSIAGQVKASSFQTILNIANSMVGSSTLVFPVLYYTSGILTSVIVSVIIGGISCKTTQILVAHNQKDEMDLPDTILRILGRKWMILFNISNVILLWVSGVIYMILICKQLYPIVILVADQLDVNVASQDDITFNMFSYQWLGVIFIVLIFPLLAQKKLQTVLKLIPYGTISIGVFLIFTIFMGCNNLINNYDQIIHNIKWITTDIQSICGVFGMALMSQCLIIPIAKNSANIDKNNRDIALGFLWTWTIYTLAGIFGALAITGKEKREGTPGNILLDYFAIDNYAVIAIQVLLFMQLTSVYPVLQFVTRSQFFGLIHQVDKCPNWQFYAFTATYAASCLIIQCLEVNVQLIISLSGAIIGLLQEYVLPVALHLTCLYGKNTKVEIIKNIQSAYNSSMSDNLIDNVDMTQFTLDDIDVKCNNHSAVISRLTQVQRTLIYGLIIIIGIAIAVGMILQIILI